MTDKKTDKDVKKPEGAAPTDKNSAEKDKKPAENKPLSKTVKGDAPEDSNDIFQKTGTTRHLKAFVFLIILFTVIGMVWQNRDRIDDVKTKITRTFNGIGDGFGFASDTPTHKKLDVFKAGDEQPQKEALSPKKPAADIPERADMTLAEKVAENNGEQTAPAEDENTKDITPSDTEEADIPDPVLFPDILSDVIDDTVDEVTIPESIQENPTQDEDEAQEREESAVTAVEENAEKLQRLNAENDALEQRYQEKIDALEAELSTLRGSLKKAKRDTKEQRELLKRFHVFSELMLEGKNAETAYRRLMKYAPEYIEDDMAFFAPLVTTGIADIDQLKALFSRSVEAAFSPSQPEEAAGAWAHATHWFKSLVVVRKTGFHEGEDDETIIARAEQELQQGDVDQAISELEGLSVENSKYFSDFMRKARINIQARHKLKKMRDIL